MPVLWKDRDSIRLENKTLALTVLTHGSHIAELRIRNGASEANLMWEAPWTTSDHDTSIHENLIEQYGGGSVGKFFAGWTGHALCLDLFGAPDDVEASHGMPLHGEAASVHWNTVYTSSSACSLRAELPIAELDLQRTLELHNDETILRCCERVSNQRSTARPVHWVQHVTLGPPFLDPAYARISTSAQRGITWPLGYEGKPALAGDHEFEWPMAPSVDHSGRKIDLSRPFQQDHTGFVVALQQKPELQFAWIAALNAQLHLLLAYVFCTTDFPWLAIWEENQARDYFPWNGTTQTRGLEFGTTPFPMGRKETLLYPSRFGTPTQRMIQGREEVRAQWIAIATEVPTEWTTIQNIHIHSDHVELIQSGESMHLPAAQIFKFLSGGSAL